MEIRNVAVIGGGLMGRQIALNAAIHGYQVKLTDSVAAVLDAVKAWEEEYLSLTRVNLEDRSSNPWLGCLG